MATFTDGDSDMQEFSMPSDGEIIVAVKTTHEGTEYFHCYNCEVASHTPRPKNQAEYLEVAEGFHDNAGIAYEFLTEKYGEPWSENGDKFLGKICSSCKCALGGWHICKFCDGVEFPGEPHTCMAFMDAANAPEESEAHQLYLDVMDGYENGWQEDGFQQHVL